MQEEAVFINGAPTSKCTNGINQRFSNLCAPI